MDAGEALAQAIQDEADNLGCGGTELGVFLSDMLDRIGVRFRHLMGDTGHGEEVEHDGRQADKAGQLPDRQVGDGLA